MEGFSGKLKVEMGEIGGLLGEARPPDPISRQSSEVGSGRGGAQPHRQLPELVATLGTAASVTLEKAATLTELFCLRVSVCCCCFPACGLFDGTPSGRCVSLELASVC